MRVEQGYGKLCQVLTAPFLCGKEMSGRDVLIRRGVFWEGKENDAPPLRDEDIVGLGRPWVEDDPPSPRG